MAILDKKSAKALVGLVIFLAFTGVCTSLLAVLLGNESLASHQEYKAIFSDATGVAKGDDVRIAGVAVGSVSKVEVYHRDKAEITFSVLSDVPLTQNTQAQLKFRNLVGQRYLALTQGADGAKSVLKPGSTIPESRTKPALDLNVLFNGFKPVFQALDPEQTNKLAFEIVQTLQGESGSVEQLLAHVSSLTNTLAGRDQLIGDVITNLSSVLKTVGDRDQKLTQTIDTLQQFVTGLKDDRQAILGSIDGITGLTQQTADLLEKGQPALVDDISQLNTLTKTLSKDKNLATEEDVIKVLPIKMSKLGRAASYGSEFNFFLCSFNLQVQVAPGTKPIDVGGQFNFGGARCEQ